MLADHSRFVGLWVGGCVCVGGCVGVWVCVFFFHWLLSADSLALVPQRTTITHRLDLVPIDRVTPIFSVSDSEAAG